MRFCFTLCVWKSNKTVLVKHVQRLAAYMQCKTEATCRKAISKKPKWKRPYFPCYCADIFKGRPEPRNYWLLLLSRSIGSLPSLEVGFTCTASLSWCFYAREPIFTLKYLLFQPSYVKVDSWFHWKRNISPEIHERDWENEDCEYWLLVHISRCHMFDFMCFSGPVVSAEEGSFWFTVE